jgi:hypothetical protein
MQLVQTDPRFIEVFKVLTGVDLLDMQEKEMKRKDDNEDASKIRLAELEKKKAEEEKARKDAEDAALPDEERIAIQNKKDADAFKLKGNEHYKKREFESALDLYQ